MFILLAAPAAFSQQQKPPATREQPSVWWMPMSASRNLPLATSAKQTDYVIGTGDLLGIDVFDVPELSREVRVNETGYISLPLIPTKIQVAGLTSFQLQDKIAELLQTNGLVSTPQVTVSLKEQRSQPVTVIGAVRTPMVIQAVRQTTLLQALSQAGGIADDAGNMSSCHAPSLHPNRRDPADSNSAPDAEAVGNGPQTFTINLGDLLESGDSRFNIPGSGRRCHFRAACRNHLRCRSGQSSGRICDPERPGPNDCAQDAFYGRRHDGDSQDERGRDSAQESGYRQAG